jgi:hypothetical protein
MRKEAGLLWYHSIGLAFSCSVGLRHTLYIIHLFKTTVLYFLPDI